MWLPNEEIFMPVDRVDVEALLQKDVDELYIMLAQQDPAHVETMFSAEEARE